MDALLLERRDFAAATAVDDADLRVAVDVFHEPDAPGAEDAAVPVQQQRRPEIDVGLDALAVEHAAGKIHPALAGAEAIRKILERALAAFVAYGAVERMVDEEELEYARAGLDDVGGAGQDDHPIRADCRTGGLQLRHLLDLDDADSARAVDAQGR